MMVIGTLGAIANGVSSQKKIYLGVIILKKIESNILGNATNYDDSFHFNHRLIFIVWFINLSNYRKLV